MDMDSQLVREALQARILVELMGNSMHKELVLKGGLAMRAVHGSVRLTKDIDLDSDAKHSRSTVHGIVVRAIRDALQSGLMDNPFVSEPKQTDTTMRWKIGGTVSGSTTPMNLTIEISRRHSLVEGHIVEMPLPESFVGAEAGAMIQVLDSQAIAVTKIMALTEPRRCAPRDLYDLNVLIQANIEPPIALLASLPKQRLTEALEELWLKIESMDYNLFRTEVLPVMPDAFSSTFTKEQFDDMQLTVAARVQSWLEAAIEYQGASSSPSLGSSPLGGAVDQLPPANSHTTPPAKTRSARPSTTPA